MIQMQINKNDYSLEWSRSQRCFHIEPLTDSLKSNLSAAIHEYGGDYIIIGIFKNDVDASAAAAYLRKEYPNVFMNDLLSEEEPV
jgi:hypothetical protein